MLRRRRLVVVLLAAATAIAVWRFGLVPRLLRAIRGKQTVEQQLARFGPGARSRLGEAFAHAGLPYPPQRIVLLAIKDERRMELFASSQDNELYFVRSYPILAASGKAGPKLREGDRQVPEGVYRVVFLNPNSLYHLSLRLDYPNTFDRKMAATDGRESLGGDIMIHGKATSIGCLAMGDEASEDLFVLAADVGLSSINVIIVPTDFRKGNPDPVGAPIPPWAPELYRSLRREVRNLDRS